MRSDTGPEIVNHATLKRIEELNLQTPLNDPGRSLVRIAGNELYYGET